VQILDELNQELRSSGGMECFPQSLQIIYLKSYMSMYAELPNGS